MKIGIFLAYNPKVNLKTEGLGRYLANLLKGFQKAGHEIILACPQWLMGSVTDLCEDYQIDMANISFILSFKKPVIWDIYDKITQPTKKLKNLKIFYTLGNFFDKFVADVMAITSVIFFCLLVLICFILAIIFLPIFILITCFYLVFKFIKAILTKSKKDIKTWLNIFNKFYIKFSNKGISFYSALMEQLTENVQKELVKKINKTINKVDIWYSPSAFWPVFNDIKGVKTLNMPDVVTTEFPLLFSDVNGALESTKNILKTINKSDFFITYCDFLKKEMRKHKENLQNDQICVVPHSINDLSEYIKIDYRLNEHFNTNKNLTKEFCVFLLNNMLSKVNIEAKKHIFDFDFYNVRYIFYASQSRPHKNIVNLLRAYEYLLREKNIPIKLILTAKLDYAIDLKEYINDRNLQFDVISFSNVSSQQLAALYACAELVVNPTLYEGGFPFTFGEGMSVGTPSVMSRIPQVSEVVDHFELCEMLFDPYNWKSIADSIEYGLAHRQTLFDKEIFLYNQLAKRTQELVAQEYVAAFQHFIDLSQSS